MKVPFLDFVGPYEEKQIAAAIRRELLREGQVFYVHNKVESIERAAARLRELVPEARIATAHGKMGEHRLEEVIVDFWEKRFDVLVCTTIVETGLDISNANTLILERADVLRYGENPHQQAARSAKPAFGKSEDHNHHEHHDEGHRKLQPPVTPFDRSQAACRGRSLRHRASSAP